MQAGITPHAVIFCCRRCAKTRQEELGKFWCGVLRARAATFVAVRPKRFSLHPLRPYFENSMLEDECAETRLSMALKFKFKSREEVPAEHLSLYAERDGAWVLDVDGVVDKTKLDEFRNNNVALIKERDELKQRFDGIDPDQVRALLTEKQKREEEALLNGAPHPGSLPNAEREKVDKLIESRIKGIKTELEKQVGNLTSERDALNARLTAIQIDQGVITVATKRGLRPTAIADITARARSVFKLVNGVPAAFEQDGKSVRYGKDGLTAMSLEEWVDTQVSEAPHLFESNSGSGAAGNASGGGARPHQGSAKNPFKRETWNLTEQMRLQKSDPQLAARLKAAA